MAIRLTERQKALFRIIAKACCDRAPSPTQAELAKALHAAGFGISPASIPWEIKRIAEAKLIKIIGAGKNRIPLYQLGRNASARTTERKRVLSPEAAANRDRLNAERLAAQSDWPIPTKASVAQYDAAMKLGKPIRIQGPADADRTTARIMRPYGNESLTGCSADMVAL